MSPGIGSRAVPKIAIGQKTRRQAKQEKRTQEALEIRLCYREVDDRDQGRCRITGVRVNPYAVSMLERGEHHHLAYRSKGGGHTTDNVILISKWAHDEIHLARLRVYGDADARDPLGRLCGVTVERLTEAGWEVWKVC